MTVFLANYPIATDNGTAYQRQRDEIQLALKTYPKELVVGVIVGNEFMLKYGVVSYSLSHFSFTFFFDNV